MIAILLRLPESLLAEIDQLAEEIYTTRSALIREALVRHLFIINHVICPAIMNHYRQSLEVVPRTMTPKTPSHTIPSFTKAPKEHTR